MTKQELAKLKAEVGAEVFANNYVTGDPDNDLASPIFGDGSNIDVGDEVCLKGKTKPIGTVFDIEDRTETYFEEGDGIGEARWSIEVEITDESQFEGGELQRCDELVTYVADPSELVAA